MNTKTYPKKIRRLKTKDPEKLLRACGYHKVPFREGFIKKRDKGSRFHALIENKDEIFIHIDVGKTFGHMGISKHPIVQDEYKLLAKKLKEL